MPDWSYHGIFKPILSALPPTLSREFIHRGMSIVASLPFGMGSHVINFLGREECSKLLHKKINHIDFPNPVGLSGKIDPLLTGTKAFTNLGFGFLEIGPVTIRKSDRFTEPKVDTKNKKIEFPKKPESIGLEETIKKLSTLRKKQPIFARLSGSYDEIKIMIEKLDGLVDGFILETAHTSIFSETRKPIYLTISNVDDSLLTEISALSGVVLETRLIENIKVLRQNGFEKTIITSGGITEPEQALELLDAGADLVMVSDGYVFAGPGLTKRINEALLDRLILSPSPQPGWFAYWLFGLFIFFGGLLALLFSVTTVILPYDEYFLEMSRQSVWNFNERIMLFMEHDRMTLAGTMISGGIVYMQLAKHGVKNGLKWAKQAIDAAAIVGFLGIFAFIGYGYFDWLHLLFWLVLLPFYVYGFVKTRNISGTPSSKNRRNDAIWKRAVYGQLAFVLLGFSFVLGGVMISYIGVTSIFVSTDLSYICMTPEMLDSFNKNLLPVLAHDRAGFGSALLSVGLLVLLISLWGFQQGNRWIWWTYLVGGIPAFIAGIYIHFAIGYTTFIHLLPAYVALGLFVVGLSLSYAFFCKN
ncbi:dihydroorotate dehydrogenase [Bacillus sp. 31A1R]|uniref:Dihydroorotate dehydrogenase n=1 Tax=Robertmurraya mangrovi TaxID=3098077 RepID=A0ABU5IYT6_9BACI|nr:dihydroorotate dehydrogenase [Bacillus sp. 31A1R]MDZ5472323.1 dihydroorotate dehydrogenase [Bacillus sp. 31A1R]